MTLLALADVHLYVGRYRILQGVSLTVEEHEVVVLLGRNGAGKTSTLRAIMKLFAPSQGQITFRDQDVTGLPTHEMAALGIGYVPENRAIFGSLTVEENLRIAERRTGQFEDKRDWIFGLFPDLERLRTWRGGRLSGGQQQMLSIARALVPDNELLLIDEPFEGLAPHLVDQLLESFTEIGRAVTILLVEQDFRAAAEISTRYCVIADGRSIRIGPIAELEHNESLLYQYLGVAL